MPKNKKGKKQKIRVKKPNNGFTSSPPNTHSTRNYDNSKNVNVAESRSAINPTLKSPLLKGKTSGSASSAGNNSRFKSKRDEVESSLVNSENDQLKEPIPKPISCFKIVRMLQLPDRETPPTVMTF